MADKTVVLQYLIHLTNRAQLRDLMATTFPGGHLGEVVMSPALAALTYSAPISLPGVPFVAPGLTSEWFGKEGQFPTNLKLFQRNSGGFLGIFGVTRTTYYWVGKFVYDPPLTEPVTGGGSPAAVSQRRWIDGFELPSNGEGGSVPGTEVSRDASRTIDGYGLALRQGTTVRSHVVDENATGITPTKTWTRFYFRIRKLPASAATFWRCRGTIENETGLALQMTPSGQIALNQTSNTGVLSLLATTQAWPVDEWHRIDVLFEFGASARALLHIDGIQAIQITGLSGGMATGGRTHVSSELGTTAANTLNMDIDDWMEAEWPPALTGPDWLHGSHMQLVQPQGRASSDAGAWPGDWRVLAQRPVTGSPGSLVTTTSLGRLALTTDAATAVDQLPNTFGCAALVVALNSTRITANGQIGYSIAGAPEVLTVAGPTSGSTQMWARVLYRPSGLTDPFVLSPLEISHVKAAGPDSSTVYSLMAVAEVLGTFGPEDLLAQDADIQIQPGHTGLHNAPYPNTPWAQLGQAPPSPVLVVAGTYAGNNVGQDLVFKAPVSFLFIRPLSGSSGGVLWCSSLMGAHRGLEEHPAASLMPIAQVDNLFAEGAGEDVQQFRYLIRLGDGDTQNNATGVTYAYLAFCDPGMRFSLNGALMPREGTVDIVTPLVNSNFLALAGFFWNEQISLASTTRTYFKGAGNAAASISQMSTAELANALTIAIGAITAKTGYYTLTDAQQIAFALFRADDGSGDPGIPRVVQILSYTGDGAASRTIGFSPATGRRPMWALVVPCNGNGAIMRDPSHTGTTSTQLPSTANASTGITAGAIDSITVGSALNTNAVAYNVIIFPGDTVAGNNGWSVAGEFMPVDPDMPKDGPWDEPFEDLDDPGPVVVVPEPEPPGGADFEVGCIADTTKIGNMALSRIGVTKTLSNVGTDQGVEAEQIRLHYTEVVGAVLRAFPWPFATRYAALTLVGGTATAADNEDWQYSYRAPTDMKFARRFVRRGTGLQRTWDDAPITFRIGSDATGPLIYTNTEVADAILEYTIYVSCAAGQGDELFRSALAWRLAHELAPGLARDEKRMAHAWAMYERQIATAAAVAANEAQPDIDRHDASWIRDRD